MTESELWTNEGNCTHNSVTVYGSGVAHDGSETKDVRECELWKYV